MRAKFAEALMRDSKAPSSTPKLEPKEILAKLIARGLTRAGWTPEQAAVEAERKKLDGLSARSIRNYRNGTVDPKPEVVKNFARLFGESERQWLAQCFDSVGLLLLDRRAIVESQLRLRPGDHVRLISTRPFLETSDQEVSATVLSNLKRGIRYTYFFPLGTPNPFGNAAMGSFAKFRDDVVLPGHLRETPLLFACGLDPGRFRYFSDLHTLVRFDSKIPEFSQAYAYVEISGNFGEGFEPAWYPLADSVWKAVAAEMLAARSPPPEGQLPIGSLNPRLRALQVEYKRWFQQESSIHSYRELRPVIGHSGDKCLDEIKQAIHQSYHQIGQSTTYLDIGCGDGDLTKHIANSLKRVGSVEVYGLDSSSRQTSEAKKCFAEEIPFTAVTAAFEEFKDHIQFNVVTAIHSLYTVDEAYIRRIYDLLAPGGVACIWMAAQMDNVVSALCEGMDVFLRSGQRRNAADDFFLHAEQSGLNAEIRYFDRRISGLLSDSNQPTENGHKLIDFCALIPARASPELQRIAVSTLTRMREPPTNEHPLRDGLVVIQRQR